MKKIAYIPLAGERLAWYRRKNVEIGVLRLKVTAAKSLQGLIMLALFCIAGFVTLWWLLYITEYGNSFAIESRILQQAMFWRASCFSLLLVLCGCFGIRLSWKLECMIEDYRRIAPKGIVSGEMQSYQYWLKHFGLTIAIGLSLPLVVVAIMFLAI